MLGLKLLSKHQPPWYRWLEARLEPFQPAVIALLLLVVGLTVLLIFKGPRWARTAWLVYLVMP